MRKRPAKTLTGLCAATAIVITQSLTPNVFSQGFPSAPAEQHATHTVYVKFISSASGAAVTPMLISIQNPTRASSTHQVAPQSALVPIQLSEGRHSISVEAEGFHRMEAELIVTAGENPVMTIELDPSAPEEAIPVAENEAVLQGHVTDADTGHLLEQVTLTLPASNMTTTTTSSGQFQFQVKVPPASESAQPAITLEARAEGYVPLRIKNLTLAAGQRRHMPLTLEKMTSETLPADIRESDESRSAGNHRSYNWVFDATIR